MTQNEKKIRDNNNSPKRSFDDELKDWFEKRYSSRKGYHGPKKIKQMKNIFFILLIPLILVSLYIASLCLISGGWVLEYFYFTYDSDAELDDTLLDELYYNLDMDSRMNITNETYFLVLSIPDLDYSTRFDYLFEFTNDNFTDLRIEQHNVTRKITSFEYRNFYNPYNLSIEFQINSTDPDILNVTIFPIGNVISGFLQTYAVDSQVLFIRLNEGEVIGGDMESQILVLPHNQRIIAVGKFHHPCPFK